MKKASKAISYLLHPLLMPTLGMLIILNSGSYLSLISSPVKRALVLIIALGTLIFPLIMLLVMHYRSLIIPDKSTAGSKMLKAHVMPQFTVLVLYLITLVYFLRLPVSHLIHSFMLATVVLLFLVMIVGIRLRVSEQCAALGGIAALVIALMLKFEIPMQGLLMLSFLLAGLAGSAQLLLGSYRLSEVLVGYLLGFGAILGTLILY